MFDVFTIAAIELGSAWMLGWLAAAAIPLALHLLHRRRQQEIAWAAIELLMQAIQQNSRTVRIEGWLLLLLRTLALILFAIALVRPLLSGPANTDAVTTQPPRLWIIVLDGSYSMVYTPGRQSLWQQAQQSAVDLVQQSGPNDAFALVQLGEPSMAIIGAPAFDASRVINEIQRLKCSDGGGDLAGCLEVVQQSIEDSRVVTEDSEVHIVFYTDMGRDTWQAAVTGDQKRTLQELSSRHFVRIESFAPENPTNLAITAMEPDSPLALQGRPLGCAVTVHNYGSINLSRVPVQFQSGGSTLRTEFVDCPAGQARTVNAQLQPSNALDWNISAVLPDDRLQLDNRRELVISVRPQVRVVTIEESSGAARLVNLSLSPSGSASDTVSSLSRRAMTVETWNTLDLQSRALGDFDAVVLVDVTELSASTVSKLRGFVQAGGALLVLVGPRTQPNAWNAPENSLKELCGFGLTEPSAPGDWRIDPLNYTSPIAKPFANFLDAGLLTTPLFRYWKIERNSDTDWVIDLAFTSGDPWIVRRAVDSGWTAVMLSAPESGRGLSSGAASWNAMATWPSFVPIMQKMIETLVGGSDQQQNVTIGQPLRGWLSPTTRAEELTVRRPDSSSSRLTVPPPVSNARAQWSYPLTDRAGVYVVSGSQQTGASQVTSGSDSAKQVYAVNINPAQSDLQSLSVDALTLGTGSKPAATARSTTLAQANSSQTEWLAQACLVALLLVLACESVLAWHLGRRLA
ncbi:MAG: VWA domain-containing protein [Pirellulaceae bacterium]|nr:VWA domain-containing protein [Pirellulaceae bacterium]